MLMVDNTWLLIPPFLLFSYQISYVVLHVYVFEIYLFTTLIRSSQVF